MFVCVQFMAENIRIATSLLETVNINDDYNAYEDDNAPILFEESPYFDMDSFTELFENKKNVFNILSFNCQSLNAKFNELCGYVETFRKLDCHLTTICLQETWINAQTDVSQFHIPGYNFISRPSSCSTHGGVAIYLRDCFSYSVLHVNDNPDIWDGLFVEIDMHSNIPHNQSKKVVVGTIYRPPRDNVENYRQFIEDLEELLSNFQRLNCEVILSGDFNIDLLKLHDRSVIHEYFETCVSNGFIPKITMPTRFSHRNGTLIDNIFTKLSDLFSSTTAGILVSNISDHLPCFVFLDYLTPSTVKLQHIRKQTQTPHALRLFRDEVACNCDLSKFSSSTTADPNNNYHTLNVILKSALNKHLPVKYVRYNKHRHKKNKWITQGIMNSIKFRDKLYIRLKNTQPDSELYNTLKINLRTYNRILKKNIRLAKHVYYDNCFKKFRDDIKQTWATIKEIMNKNQNVKGTPKYFLLRGFQISDHKSIANEFNNFFVNIGPNLASNITTVQNKTFKDYLRPRSSKEFKFQRVNVNQVKKGIDDLKSKTSSGIDNISNKFLKLIKNEICEPLTLIVNQCFTTGIFPDDLKIAKVIPVYKKDEDFIFDNYRPVSVLPSISKIIERIMHDQVHKYFSQMKLYYSNQYGFRKDHSTELAALEFVDRALNFMDKGETPISIFLDLSKAFDTLDHDILLHKLSYYGITDTALKLFKNYLSNRYQYVTYENSNSTLLRISTGVPQGSILGPLLFLIYVNDLQNVCKIFHPIMYADDTTLSATLSTSGDAGANVGQNINLELESISTWLKLNKLSLNVSKTKAMVFHMPQKTVQPPQLIIENSVIEYVTEFNFLGITLDSNLSWKAHVSKIHTKVSRTIAVMNRMKHILPGHILLTIYNSLVLPYLHYGLLAWGVRSHDLQKLQKKAVRIITSSKYNAHTEPIFKSLDLLKLSDLCVLRELKFCYKLEHGLLPFYFTTIFTRSRDIHQHGTRHVNNFQIPNIRHEFARNSVRYKIARTYNDCPVIIKQKILTHSFQGFCTYVKKYLLNTYSVVCTIPYCYICSSSRE